MEADITSQAVGLASNTDFSIISLFIRADIIVKSVIIILIVASIYSWAIIIEKYRLFKKINSTTEEFENKFWKSKSAETFYNNLPANIDDPMANLFKDTMQVVIKSRSKSNLSERLANILEVNIEKQQTKHNDFNMAKKNKKSDSSSSGSSSSDNKTDTGSTEKTDTSAPKSGGNSFTRGERQKVVTNSYRSSWDRIFSKKKSR